MTQPTPLPTVEALLKQQRDEYGKWVAVVPILHDGAAAYAPGHAVPDGNVQKYGYDKDGLVAKVGTKAAAAVSTPNDKDA